MWIGRHLNLAVASVAFLAAVAGCSGGEDDSLALTDAPSATDEVEMSADEALASQDDVEKAGEFTQCFSTQQNCEDMRQFLENQNNDCGPCVANGCGTGVFSLTCSPE